MTAQNALSRLKTSYAAAIAARRRWLLLALLVGLAGGGLLFWRMQREEPVETPERLPQVTVRTVADLAEEITIDKVAAVEPAVHAPLVARGGGVVTAIPVQLGEAAAAGATVVRIDGMHVPNAAAAQAAAAQAALAAFAAVEQEAVQSAKLAADIARASLDAAQTGKQLSREQADVARQQADVQVHQAELSLRDARESEQRSDALIRAADVALQAAGLAQDQATTARRLAYEQTNDALAQAQLGAAAAEQAIARLRADLQSQRAALSGQAAVSREQVQLQQVISPVNGEVTRLSVRVGDFVQPGTTVGEVTAAAGAQVRLAVSHRVRTALSLGQLVAISTDTQEFSGTIAQLASAPSAETALWQVDIFITETPAVIHPGDLVVVHLPAAQEAAGELFVPLDAVVIRQAGAFIFTIDADNVAHELPVTVTGYAGKYAAVTGELPAETRVALGGNRQLREGLHVMVQP